MADLGPQDDYLIYLYRSQTCNKQDWTGRGRLLGGRTEDQELVITKGWFTQDNAIHDAALPHDLKSA